ncbi:dihydrolipoyl dehydrogenase family protein [Microbispora catharanthi]|uniref:NAD(P)/FAD-dependent oxidoreductase n=1 Tax=Microbispora catharanthi TaxID=1712871 RepID=A0A5N6BLD9_9ACTN|nr:NAD(P)/FAD-dependent oxidoreductase [Microbispora catharanthi]KAB8180629.1 NAD(P)/FAD-dependent oxidoreductase [Microbispora catharanthi]
MKKSFDVVVIGTGEAGSAVAMRCRAAGRNVAIVDSRPFGGTCGLRGCDPKKVLVGAAEIIDRKRRMEGRGVAGDLRIDWPELIRFKATFTDPFPRQREDGFVQAGVEPFHGRARFLDQRSIEVGQDVLDGAHLVVAVGAWPARLGIQGEHHLTRSDQFLDLQELPRRIAFVGGGYIGFEFGHIAARAGATVTILHGGARPLKHFDHDLVARLLERTRDLGIDVRTGTKVTGVEGAPGSFKVTALTDSGPEVFEADMVVHSAGRAPEVDDLDLSAAGVEFDRRGIRVNGHLQSVSNPAVYAAGDAADSGGLPETPLAQYEGGLVAENIVEGNQRTADYLGMASVVYSIPALSAVGMTEEEAHLKGLTFTVNQADTSGWYSARRVAEPASMYKILIEKDSGRILGAHLLGPEADEFANVFALAIRADVRADALKHALFVYPTQASNMAWML